MAIFVSYTLKDKCVNKNLLQLIKERCNCYIDLLDNDSENKQGRVERELQNADALLLIESPSVMCSHWVLYELSVARMRKIEIFKINYKEIGEKKWKKIKWFLH